MIYSSFTTFLINVKALYLFSYLRIRDDMATVIKIGILFVHLALIFYTFFIIYEHKHRKTTNQVLAYITFAIIFDIVATGCMMAGTTSTYFTFHGIVGYSGLLLMIIDAILLWRHKIKTGVEELLSKGLNLYSKLAFVWWIIAFTTGVIVSLNNK